jgi:hypothetical protein
MFPASVEFWRQYLDQYSGGDLPGGMDFLLAWIQRESNGDPCSYTSLHESGIFQLMPPDNTNTAGTTEAALRSMCSGGSGSQTRQMTDAEIKEQVVSGLQYVRAMRDQAQTKLDAAGVDWPQSSPDFWKVVKLQHAYPGPTAGWLLAATTALGRPPQSWDEMVSNGIPQGAYQSVLANADWVGSFGSGGSLLSGGNIVPVVIVAGAAALLYMVWDRYR